MSDASDNLVLVHLRELRASLEARTAQLDRKLDAVLADLHEIRTEAAADRAHMSGVNHAIQSVQRRLIRTDERVAEIERRLARVEDG
jgi:chromosome segregation ATPase